MRLWIGVAVGTLALGGVAQATPTTFSAAGAANVATEFANFQAAMGSPLNGNTPGQQPGGRRQINWDAGIVPFNMPGGFFNSPPTTRGANLTTPGTGFAVSNDGFDDEFDSLNASYPDQFTTFSPARLVAPVGSNILEINFLVAGTNVAARTSGFGAVFTDVDLANTTMIEYFDADGVLIASQFVLPDPQGLSFLGVAFDTVELSRARITLGTTAIGPNDNPGGGIDIVVLDDFIYSEPIPEAPALAIFVSGLVALGLVRRRRRRA